MHKKSLMDANYSFLEKHKGVYLVPTHTLFGSVLHVFLVSFGLFADSLMHRTAVAELLYVLEPNKKKEAIKLIEDSTNDLVSAV